MAAYLLCLSSGGGIPLFCRIKGDIKPLSFPVIGSLNGIHMFCGSQEVELKSTITEDSKIIWKVYYKSITLILATRDDNASDAHLTRLLDCIFHAMVLVYGLDDLTNIKNVERFKREIKVCFQMVDYLLQQIDNPLFSDVTQAVDVICAPENAILQNYLDAFTDAANSPYGCVLVKGKVAVATKQWWVLSAVELVLLSVLVNSLPKCSSRDIATFLPVTSPKVPHRLLTFQLVQGVEVCVMCSTTPTLAELERDVDRFWKTSLDSLHSILQLYPRSIPNNMILDPNILGFMLLNTRTHRCLCTVHPQDEDPRKAGKTLNTRKRKEVLRGFYKNVVGNLWLPPLATDSEKAEESYELTQALQHTPTDTYICTAEHKCYALESGPHQIFVLYTTSVPTYAMRSVTTKTLQMLLKDKGVRV